MTESDLRSLGWSDADLVRAYAEAFPERQKPKLGSSEADQIVRRQLLNEVTTAHQLDPGFPAERS